MKKFYYCLLIIVLLISCDILIPRDGEKSSKISGVIQKGPFVMGSSVTIQELNSSWIPSGKVYQTTTSDSLGSFDLNAELDSNKLEIITNGYYYDEVTGELSASTLTLKALTDLNNDDIVNVNILTTLEVDRILYLIKEGKSFSEAKSQAQSEVLNIFGIHEEDVINSNEMSIIGIGDSNAILLAVSVLLQFNNSPASLTEFLSEISNDIKTDGILSNMNLLTKILYNSNSEHFKSVNANLTSRYSELGIDVQPLGFMDFLDDDSDGVVNRHELSPVSTDVESGKYNNTLNLTLTTKSEGCKIYYTLDGSEPTLESNIYKTSLLINKSVTIKARTIGDVFDSTASEVSVFNYDLYCEAPTYTYNYLSNNKSELEISTDLKDADIYYTLNGEMPDVNSFKYTSKIELDVNHRVEVKSIVTKKDFSASKVKKIVFYPIGEIGDELTFGTGNGVMNFVWVPITGYLPDTDSDNFTPYPTNERGFWMSKYETTEAQWHYVLGYYNDNDQRPKCNINFDDFTNNSIVDLFGSRYNNVLDLFNSKYNFEADLPKTDYWVHAYRAGTTTKYFWGDNADDYSNYAVIEFPPRAFLPVNTGLVLPNTWGLYDMAGNAWEITKDGKICGGNIRSKKADVSYDLVITFSGWASHSIGFRLMLPVVFESVSESP